MAAVDQSGEGPRPRRMLSIGYVVAIAGVAALTAGTLVGGVSPSQDLASVGPTDLDVQLATLSSPVDSYSIAIDTTGYQVELDACQWVRMDLSAAAPIVGAHNYCGGDIVLHMRSGDVIELSGEGLDGTYVVTEIRDAVAGASAREATDAMAVTAILQTCYWGDTDAVRLVGLVATPSE